MPNRTLLPNHAIKRRPALSVPLAFAAAVSLAGLVGCSKPDDSKKQSQGPAGVPVDVASARTDSVQRSVDAIGTLYGEEDTTISNKVNGRIIAIYKDLGDRVGPGEPLAQLLRNDYLLDLNQKRAALLEVLAKLGMTEMPPTDFDLASLPSIRRSKLQVQNAESKYNRGKQLHAQQPPLLSDQDFEDLLTALDVSKSAYDSEVLVTRGLLGEAATHYAELLQAEQALKDTTVRAPRPRYAAPDYTRPISDIGRGLEKDAEAGPMSRPSTQPSDDHSYIIAARYGNEGELAKAITPLFRLVDDDPLKLRAAVPERYFPDIAIGQDVTVSLSAYPGKPFAGKLTRINPQVDPANRTFTVEIIVPNADHALSPGAFANASIRTRLEPGMIFIPSAAIVTFAGVDKVYVIDGDKAKEVIVTLGDRRGNDVEIRKGLLGTERVATSGTSRLSGGVAVQVKGSGGVGR